MLRAAGGRHRRRSVRPLLPIRPDGQNTCGFAEIHVKPSPQKYLPFRKPETVVYSCHLAPTRGTFGQSSRHVGRDAMDAKVRRRCALERTVKSWSWSPDAGINPRLKSPGGRRLTSPVLRREREVSRKPLRRECRMFRPTCTDLWAPFLSAHEACGCGQRPAFPAPSLIDEGGASQNSGRSCRENADVCLGGYLTLSR